VSASGLGPPVTPGRSAAWGRTAPALAVTAAVLVLLLRHRGVLDAGARSVARADPAWLGVGAVAVALLWAAGTVSQLGAIPAPVPLPRLLLVQVAATFANHLLPAGAGGMAVIARFLRRQRLSRAAAIGAIALNRLAGIIAHTALLVVVLCASPDPLRAALPDGRSPHTLPLALWMLGCVLVVLAVPAVRRRARARWAAVRPELRGQLAVLRSPARAVQLWGGSLAVPMLHCLTLYAVNRSLGGEVPALSLALAYLVASAVTSVLPSPGGFGALDVALVAGLVAAGADTPAAVATVLAYRLLTVWIPLLPGGCVLAVLLRRRVL
jgi:uncharacterized membrane protein YbhN (UPF0104 family)